MNKTLNILSLILQQEYPKQNPSLKRQNYILQDPDGCAMEVTLVFNYKGERIHYRLFRVTSINTNFNLAEEDVERLFNIELFTKLLFAQGPTNIVAILEGDVDQQFIKDYKEKVNVYDGHVSVEGLIK